ncbi:tetratricopeptide repeat protein [Angustibacter luteus]|uniref:Co-chaperone YbbN n=1 Tax=Angustibacter luteus TaxID=658456 RepID=A0ABW1JHF4_9ACTN
MSQPPVPPASSIPLRGAVDLAAVAAQAKRREQAAANAASGGPGPGSSSGVLVEATEETFQTLVELSLSVPVVVVLWASYSEQSQQVTPVLERLAVESGGRFLVATVEIDTNPRLAQVFQAQAVPSVVAVIKGQPVPLFQGVLPEAQVKAYLDELLKVAEANGVTGTVPTGAADPGSEDDAQAAPSAADELEPLPPLHQEAYDAIERGDLDAAAAAYEKALLASPADDEAKAGLSQVNLLRRTEGADLPAARAAAAAAPQDPQAQILVADLDLLGGHVEDAFARLVDAVRVTSGDERNALRLHLVELFEVVGSGDPRVVAARRALSSALY